MSSSSETSTADAGPAPVSPSPEAPRRRHGGWLFLVVCLLALVALLGLLLVAFQLNREQGAWESGVSIRQQQLMDLNEQIKKAQSEIDKLDDRRRDAENLRRKVEDLSPSIMPTLNVMPRS